LAYWTVNELEVSDVDVGVKPENCASELAKTIPHEGRIVAPDLSILRNPMVGFGLLELPWNTPAMVASNVTLLYDIGNGPVS
jgi:hypothetical protein